MYNKILKLQIIKLLVLYRQFRMNKPTVYNEETVGLRNINRLGKYSENTDSILVLTKFRCIFLVYLLI